jgi:hypothetical protein
MPAPTHRPAIPESAPTRTGTRTRTPRRTPARTQQRPPATASGRVPEHAVAGTPLRSTAPW